MVQAALASVVDGSRAPADAPGAPGVDFPTRCVIPVADLAAAVEEFPATGPRPTRVPWQRVR
ncbi:Imm1 family immunity protein [Actinosynnema sp. NPDC051121]|nr:hypothetical protein [Saccharothrix sp.]